VCDRHFGDLTDRILISRVGQIGVQPHQRFAKVAGQHDILFGLPAKGAFRSQHLLHGINVFIPPKGVVQVVRRGILDECVFV